MEHIQVHVTQLLNEIRSGDQDAQATLIDLLYGEIRATAKKVGAKEGSTISPTVLAHDASLKIFDKAYDFRDRFHFMATLSVVMRNLLIDYIRERNSKKRGGMLEKVALFDKDATTDQSEKIEGLLACLEKLRKVNERQSRFLELKYFVGLTLQEIADGFEISVGTVHNELKAAEAWLYLQMK